MSDALLRKELAKKVFGNLGMVPMYKAGITLGEGFTYNKTVQLIDDSDNYVYPVFAADLYSGQDFITVIACKHGESPDDFSAVFYLNGGYLGVKVLWEDPFGDFLIWHRDGWVSAPLHEALGFLSALECATTEGLVWQPAGDAALLAKLYDKLITLIDFGEN